MAEAWPAILKPQSIGFWPENVSRGGGAALNGQEQTVSSTAGRWRARVVVPIRNDAQVLEARALMARLEGRANSILVPAFDGRRANWPVESGIVLSPGRTRRKALDGTTFEDLEVPAISEIEAVVDAAAALGDMQIVVDVTQGSIIRVGQYFGLGNRMHIFKELLAGIDFGGTYAIWPPLRAAVLTGVVVKLSRPVCEMKLLSDDQGLRELDQMRFGELALELREAF